MNKKIANVNKKEIEKEAEAFKSICFVTRANDQRYTQLLGNLKCVAYREKDEYPETLTSAYDLLVRESG